MDMTANDLDLLGQFAREKSQDAFTTLVNRHLGLVYSAALRQVRSPQLAEEVCQTVFANLAGKAASLSPDTVLTAWLYHVTRLAAIDLLRREARRQAREQIAFQMSDLNDTSADWTQIEPLLDEAMHSLDDTDRTAILLRYFENKSLREVGEALGASEDAAQKRVSRALERLREFCLKRKVSVGVSGLAALLSANAIQAAPAGLGVTVATGAVAASVALTTSTAVAITKTIAMTTLQKTIVGAVLTGALVTGIFQASQVADLRQQVQTLRQADDQRNLLSNQVQDLVGQRDRATNALASLTAEIAALRRSPNEVLKLRGEVGRLRQENATIGSSSALSKVTADPKMTKLLRDQQKMGMSIIYKGLSQSLKLTPEQTGQLNELLADHIMVNVGNVTTALRDKLTTDQMNQVFAGQETVLQQQVQTLLGADGLTRYQDYTKDLLSTLTTEQFKGQLTGDDAAKREKAKQLAQVLQEETQAVLAKAGLPADYQTVPILNFCNIASEQEGERSLKILEDIYQRVAERGGVFLSPEEIKKFQEFKTAGVENNRASLAMNRTLMAPISN